MRRRAERSPLLCSYADTQPSASFNPLAFSLYRTLAAPPPAPPAQPTHTHFNRSETPFTLQGIASCSSKFCWPFPQICPCRTLSLVLISSFSSLGRAPACSQLLLVALLYVWKHWRLNMSPDLTKNGIWQFSSLFSWWLLYDSHVEKSRNLTYAELWSYQEACTLFLSKQNKTNKAEQSNAGGPQAWAVHWLPACVTPGLFLIYKRQSLPLR